MRSPRRRMSPACSVVWPMIVSSGVDLPTPLGPMMDRLSPCARGRSMPSNTCVPPYPAVTPFNVMFSGIERAAEVDRAHFAVGGDFRRRALGKDAAAHQHRDAIGKTEHEVHVMLDDEYRDVLWQRGDCIQQDVALGAGNPGRGLI